MRTYHEEDLLQLLHEEHLDPKITLIIATTGDQYLVGGMPTVSLDDLRLVVDEGLYSPGSADLNAPGDPRSQMLFVVTPENGNPVMVETVREIADKINWTDPSVAVVFKEWTFEARCLHYRDREDICYQRWFEHLGYTRILGLGEFDWVRRYTKNVA